MKRNRILLLIITMIVGVAVSIITLIKAFPMSKTTVKIQNNIYNVEIATSPLEQQQGLSERVSLGKNEGMLFVLHTDQQPEFWMKEMNFPIDIVWLNAERRIVKIDRNVPVEDSKTPLSAYTLYSVEVPVRYVLELNAGQADEKGIHIGDQAKIQGLWTR